MEKKLEQITVVEQYKKYLEAIKSSNVRQAMDSFNRFDSFLLAQYKNKNLNDDLFSTLRLASMCKAVEHFKKLKLKYKQYSVRWDTEALNKFYDLKSKLTALKARDDIGDRYAVLFGQLWKLIESQEDIPFKLYLLTCLYDSPIGFKWLVSADSTANKLLKSSSNEEIERALRPTIDNKLELQQACANTSKEQS